MIRAALAPFIADYLLLKKSSHLIDSRKPFDVLSVGSSYTYRGFIPDEFEAVADRAGMELNAYNLAAPGAYAFEVNHYLTRVVDGQKRSHLPDFVLIELFPILDTYVIQVMPPNRLTTRMIEYHDFETTWLNVAAVALAPFSFREKVEIIQEHLLHLTYRLFNVGLLGAIFRPSSVGPGESGAVESGGGYFPHFTGKNLHKKKFEKAEYRKSIEAYRKLLKQQKSGGQGKHRLSDAEKYFRRRQVLRLTDLGIQVLFVVPPVPYGRQLVYHRLCREEPFFSTRCLDLSDIEKYPRLFEYRNRYDLGHLNHRGAILYSRHLAEQFLSHVADIPAPGRTNLIESYAPGITSWYGSIREQAHNLPNRIDARPGPPNRPTLYEYKRVRMGPYGRIRFSFGIREEYFARSDGVRFSVHVNGVERYSKVLASGQTPSHETDAIELPLLKESEADLVFRTDCGGSQSDDRAYWQDIILE